MRLVTEQYHYHNRQGNFHILTFDLFGFERIKLLNSDYYKLIMLKHLGLDVYYV